MDPKDERVPGLGGLWEDLSSLPPGIALPPGASKSRPKEYYVQSYTTRDGRTFYEFYKRTNQGEGKPDPVEATVEGPPNQDVKSAWEKEQAEAAKPPAAPTTRNINGVPHQYDPATNSWVPAQTAAGPAQPTTAATQKPPGGSRDIEGTPDPSKPGGYDNERPRWVTRDATGKEVWTEPVVGTDLDDWREARERSRNPGGKTDAEMAADAKANATANDPVGKPTGNTREREENGQRIRETEYVLPDGRKEWRTQSAPAAQSSARTPQLAPDKKSWGYWENDRWVTIPADKAPPLPGEEAKPPTEIDGVFGNWQQKDGQWTFVPAASQPGQTKLPEGAPEIDTSTPQAAFDSFQRLTAWVQQQVRAGAIRPTQVKEILSAPHTQVSMVLDREQQQASNALTQRTQDTSIQTNSLSNATSGLGTATEAALKIAEKSGTGGHGMAMMLGTLALQRIQAQQLGWNPDGIAPVVANPLVPGPVANGVAPYRPGAAAPAAAAPAAGAPAPAPAVVPPAAESPVGLPLPLLPPRPPIQPPVAAGAGESGSGVLPDGRPVNAGARTYVNTRTGETQLLHPTRIPNMPDGDDWEPDGSPPIQMAPPVAPLMAMGNSLGGGYAPAVAALKRLGFDDGILEEAMRSMGVA